MMADPGDAVQLGLVASLARPGTNITGVTSLAPALATKRMALLKEAFSNTARVAVLWNSAIPPAEVALKELQAAAPVLGVDLQFVEVPGPPGFAEAFAAITREHADAFFVFPDPLTFGNRESIVGFANKNSIPALFGAREFVEVGGLMSYGSDYPALFRRAGNMSVAFSKEKAPQSFPSNNPQSSTWSSTSKLRRRLGSISRQHCSPAPTT